MRLLTSAVDRLTRSSIGSHPLSKLQSSLRQTEVGSWNESRGSNRWLRNLEEARPKVIGEGVTGLVTRPRGELAQRHLSVSIPKRASVLSLTHPSLAPRNRRNFNSARKRSTTKPLDLHPTSVSQIHHKSEAMPTHSSEVSQASTVQESSRVSTSSTPASLPSRLGSASLITSTAPSSSQAMDKVKKWQGKKGKGRGNGKHRKGPARGQSFL